MDLKSIILEQLNKLLEGGDSFGEGAVDRINKEDIKPTIEALQSTLLDKIGIDVTSTRVLGSAGMKVSSGDLDVGVAGDMELEQMFAAVQKAGIQCKMNRGLSQVSIVFPQYTAAGQNGKFVQVDLVKGDLDYLQWSHSSTPENKGGVMLRAMMGGVIKVITNQAVNNMRGVFSRTHPAKYKKTDADYSRDLPKLMQQISVKSKEPWTVQDSMQPANVIWEKAKRSFTPEECSQIAAYFKEFMANQKIPVPEWLGEAKAPGQGKVAMNLSGQTAGGGGDGAQGGRNRGKVPKGMVPDSLRNKAPAPGNEDEGFAVLEAENEKRGKYYFVHKLNTIAKEMGYGISGQPASNFGDGVARVDPNFKVILVNKDADPSILAFAIAHELGHVVVSDTPEKLDRGLWLGQLDSYTQAQAKEYIANERAAWDAGEKFVTQVGADIAGYKARRDRSMALNKKNIATKIDFSLGESVLLEAADPKELEFGIPHIDDLKPEEFMEFLQKYSNMTVKGGIEVSEKVDGSARVSFGKTGNHIWTQSKNGSRKEQSSQYGDNPLFRALKHAHEALESGAQAIIAAWPEDVTFFVAEVLYTRIPNNIEYGPNVLMIHGVHTVNGTMDDAGSKKAANSVIKAVGGQLSDGKEPWQFEYKRTIEPKDVMVNVKKEFDTLGELAQELQKTPRDKDLKGKFKAIQKQVKDKLIGQLRKQKSAYGPEGGDVEGIVFRDLESGQMYKLVDKDFFKNISDFLWQFRKMIDQGIGSGDQKKIGVIGGFRKTIADDVLGDPSAGSTQLVKNILGVAKDVTGNTPEERADKAIAKYIQTKNLMGPGFADKFQKGLEQSIENLNKLQSEWGQFKSKPQTANISGKTRTFPPEHTQRTEEAFQWAQAQFQGIRAGLEVAMKIQHPLTQKVALFKLFMGHKFDRLASELGGNEIEEGVGKWARGAAAGLALGAAAHTAPERHLHMPTMQITAKAPTVEEIAKEAGKKYNVPFELIMAMMDVESTGNTAAVSPKGARGLMQLMPKTATAMGVTDPHNPVQNIDGGAKYVRKLINAFNGNLDRVLAAYNAGPNAIRKMKKNQLPKETQDYIVKVKARLGKKPIKLQKEALQTGVITADENAEARLIADKFRDKLTKRGISLNNYLGSGFYGTAYDMGNGKVFKVTTDPDEARSSFHLLNKDLKYVVKYYDVFKFPLYTDNPSPAFRKEQWFGIVMEKVAPLPPNSDKERRYTSAVKEFLDVVGEENWKNPQWPWANLSGFYEDEMMYEPEANPEEVLSTLELFNIPEIREELLSNGIAFSDIHGGNLGYSKATGVWKMFDLGSESLSPGELNQVPQLEGSGGGPIDRGTGPTDLSGIPIKPENPDTLESLVREGVMRMLNESQQGTIGVTLGRFQPFHAGHATIIRDLCKQFNTVVVFIAGQKQDKKNPFSNDLRLKMMEASLPDVWSKIKVFPASIQGKGTGYIPSLIANVAASGDGKIPENGSVAVLVGEDRVADISKQVEHNTAHQGEPGYYTGMITVDALPGVKNDDDTDRISGTRLREALAKNDQRAVMKMLDPNLAKSPQAEEIYTELRAQMKMAGLAETLMREITGGDGGGFGSMRTSGVSGWSRAILAKDMTGDEIKAQMGRNTTRMLPLDNHGHENIDLPGYDSLDMDFDDEQDASKPTDLGEMVYMAFKKLLSEAHKMNLSSPTDFQRAKGINVPVDKTFTFTPWSPGSETWPDYSTKSVPANKEKGQPKATDLGPGEVWLVTDPNSPLHGGTIAGGLTHYDIVKGGKKYEVKGIDTANIIGISGKGKAHREKIIIAAGSLMEELKRLRDEYHTSSKEQRMTFDKALPERFPWNRIFTYLDIVSRGGKFMSFTRGHQEELTELIDQLSRINQHLSDPWKIHHPWINKPGSFKKTLEDVDYKSFFDEADGGIFLTSKEQGYFHIPLKDAGEWFTYNDHARTMNLRLKKLPYGKRAADREEKDLQYTTRKKKEEEETAEKNARTAAAKAAKQHDLELWKTWARTYRKPKSGGGSDESSRKLYNKDNIKYGDSPPWRIKATEDVQEPLSTPVVTPPAEDKNGELDSGIPQK